MARINFDDNVESQEQFWRLLPLVGGDRDAALGKLVRFFRLAQYYYGRSLPIPAQVLTEEGLQCMIASGWAEPHLDGFRARGAEKHFAWYVQKVEAGKRGGRPKNREEPSDNRPVISANRDKAPVNPLAPVLAPAPVPALAKENIYTREAGTEAVGECVEAWAQTLNKYGISKSAKLDEVQIARLIQIHGAEKTRLALIGAGFERKTERYNPAEYCRISRLLKPDIFELCVNLGARTGTAKAQTPDDTDDLAEFERRYKARKAGLDA